MGIEEINAINQLEDSIKKLKQQMKEIETQLNNHIQTPDTLAHKGII